MPDWGEAASRQPLFPASDEDDEAVARRLQEQYNREVGGGSSPGLGSLEDESLAVARQLQVCQIMPFSKPSCHSPVSRVSDDAIQVQASPAVTIAASLQR